MSRQGGKKNGRRALFLWVLIAGVWLGSSMTSYLVIPALLFGNIGSGVESSSAAGFLAGEVFHRHHLVSIFCLPLLLAIGAATSRNRLRGTRDRMPLFVLAFVLLLVGVEMIWITPEVARLRTELTQHFGSPGAAPTGDPARSKFFTLHAVSVSRALIEIVLGLAATALFYFQTPGQTE